MRHDYTDREIKMINALLDNITKINSESEKIIEDIDETTIVQIGENSEEKLFLLNALLDDIVKDRRLQASSTSALNENAVNLTKSLKRILKDKELVYSISVPRIPGFELPCSNLFEAKKIANSLIFEANVLYNNQVIL